MTEGRMFCLSVYPVQTWRRREISLFCQELEKEDNQWNRYYDVEMMEKRNGLEKMQVICLSVYPFHAWRRREMPLFCHQLKKKIINETDIVMLKSWKREKNRESGSVLSFCFSILSKFENVEEYHFYCQGLEKENN